MVSFDFRYLDRDIPMCILPFAPILPYPPRFTLLFFINTPPPPPFFPFFFPFFLFFFPLFFFFFFFFFCLLSPRLKIVLHLPPSFTFRSFGLNTAIPSLSYLRCSPSDGMLCCRSDWPGLLFVLLLSTLCVVRQQG